VIFPETPNNIYCGLRNRERDSRGCLNAYRFDDPLYVEGHVAISRSRDVLFAGVFLIVEGQLKFWTNGSGHYKPNAECRFDNFTDPVWCLLPEKLFQLHSRLTEGRTQALEAYVKIPETEDYSSSDNDSGSSLSDSDEGAAYLARRRKKRA